MALGRRDDPFLGLNFLVEISGLVVAGFSEVSGLQSEIEVKEYREGGVNAYMHKFAGPTRYASNLTLKRGIVSDNTLWGWYFGVTQGVIARLIGSVVLLDNAGSEARRWVFVDAYPVKWLGPSLNAASANVAVETIELVHRGLYAV